MRNILFSLIAGTLCLMSTISVAQAPEKFNYQAVLRNGSGELISDQSVDIEISIRDIQSDGAVLYTETHNKNTNLYGLVNLVIGTGSVDYGVFSEINWASNDKFIQVKVDATDMGTFQLLSVPFAMHAASASNLGSDNVYTGTDTLFVVKDMEGNPVFVVFPDGAKVIVEEATKGTVGGFAVSGRSPTKAEETEIFRVTPDSTRIFVNDTIQSKGRVGGFAVSGRSPTKGITSEYLVVTQDSTRVYISDTTLSKGRVGGFAVSGRSPTKAETKDYFNISGNAEVDTVNSEARIFWYPKKEAFLTGRVLVESPDSVGTNSMATGYESKAIGDYSQAMGYKAVARGDYSTAIGDSAIANGLSSFSFGEQTYAYGNNSFAFGKESHALGNGSYALGSSLLSVKTQALNDDAFAMGLGCISNGIGAISIGTSNSSSADYSFSAGRNSDANNIGSTAIGHENEASGDYATALGYNTTASGNYSTALGYSTTASGLYSTSTGYNTLAQGENSTATGRNTQATGNNTSAFGYGTIASGLSSIAMGMSSTATGSYSTVIGYNSHTNYDRANSTAIGYQCNTNSGESFAAGSGAIAGNSGLVYGMAYAIGHNVSATGGSSLCLGVESSSAGFGARSIGYYSHANNNYSTAIGHYNVANGDYSTALGDHTQANTRSEFVVGTGNILSTGSATNWIGTDPLFVIGNSPNLAPRSNALTVLKNGNVGIGTATPAQKLDVLGDVRLSGGDRTIEVISGYLNIRPHDATYGLLLRDYTGNSSIWSNFRTINATTDYLHIAMNSTTTTEGLVISDNGNIGIGATTPGFKLEVNGSISADYYYGPENNDYLRIDASENFTYVANSSEKFRIDANGNVGIKTTPTHDLTISSTSTSITGLMMKNTTSTRDYLMQVCGSGVTGRVSNFEIWNTSYSNPSFVITAGNNIGISTTNPGAYRLYVNGSAYSTGGWTGSDIKFKDNIQDLDSPLITLMNVRGVSYNWKTDLYPEKGFADGKHYGVIAQELELVLPELIKKGPEGDLAVAYLEFIPILIEATQEQQSQIEKLKSENQELWKENEEFKNRLNKIEKLLLIK